MQEQLQPTIVMKKELTPEEIEKKEKQKKTRIFLARFFGYIVIGLLIPVGFLIWKFDLFQTESHRTFGGWGVVTVIFTTIFLIYLCKQAEFSVDSQVGRQTLRAIRKVLFPLFCVTFCLFAVRNFIDELIQFFIVITVCEPIAYVINPFPQLIRENDDKKEVNKFIKAARIFWGQKDSTL